MSECLKYTLCFLLVIAFSVMEVALADTAPLSVSARRGTVTVRVDTSVTSLQQTLFANTLSLSGTDAELESRPIGKKFSFNPGNGVSVVVVRSPSLRAQRSYKPLVESIFVGGKSLATPAKRTVSKLQSAPRVSVGGILIRKTDGTPAGNVPGTKRPYFADSSFIGTLVNAERKCGKVVVDPDYDPAYAAIVKELRLGSGRLADPRFRKDFSTAQSVLSANAPQYRLTGDFVQLGKTNSGSAHLELVDLSSGQTVWRKEYFGAQSVETVSADAANEVWARLCTAPVPRVISGTYSGADMGSAGLQWSGTFRFRIDPRYEMLTLAEIEALPAIPYLITELSGVWEEHGNYPPCRTTANGSHAWTSAELDGGGQSAPLTLRLPDRNLAPEYLLVFGRVAPSPPNPVTQLFECDGGSTFTSMTSWGVSAQSSILGQYTPFSAGGFSAGSLDDGDRRYFWSLQVDEYLRPVE